MGDEEAQRRIQKAMKFNSPSLDLSELQLTRVPPEIGGFHELVSLDLHNNHLGELTPEIGGLAKLKSLNLDGNRLTTLPAEIGQLKNLTTLGVGGNIIGSLPPEVAMLRSLTEIFLTVNQLTELPDCLFGLRSLRSLHLTRNRLTSLPAGIGTLSNLTRLDLDGNSLTSLPSEIRELQNLTRLDLDGNRLTAIPPELAELTQLATLYLSRNRLTQVPPSVLLLTGLRELTIGGNDIDMLPSRIRQVSTVERLDVADNNLGDLPIELADLARLDSVSARTSDSRTSSLLLQGNPLPEPLLRAADGGMDQLRQYLRNRPSSDEDPEPSKRSRSRSGSGFSQPEWHDLAKMADRIEFREVIDAPEANSLRKQIERLIGLATEVLDSNVLANRPLVEQQAIDDRNLLQQELIRSPSIDAAVVVPHLQRLIGVLAQVMDSAEPGAEIATRLVERTSADPRSTNSAAERAETLSDALDDSNQNPPIGYSSWRTWLIDRLGWLGRLDRTDIGLGGGALVTGGEVASMLGATGPAGIVIGVVTAVLAVAFRPRDTSDEAPKAE